MRWHRIEADIQCDSCDATAKWLAALKVPSRLGYRVFCCDDCKEDWCEHAGEDVARAGPR